MPEQKRCVRIVTHDESLFATTRGAVSALEGWEISEPQSVEDLLAKKHGPQDIILLDAWLRTENVYESCRRLAGKTKCRTYIVPVAPQKAASSSAKPLRASVTM